MTEIVNWHARAAAPSIPGAAFIGGRYVPAAAGGTFDSVDPATGAVLGSAAACEAVDVCFGHGDISSPFGGFEQSGFGRVKSLHALEKYSELTATRINLGNRLQFPNRQFPNRL